MKTLTEQWLEGMLPDGAYYILVDKYEQNEPEIDVGVCYNSNFEWWIVKEVLAPVPNYDEYKELVRKSDKFDKIMSDTVTNQGDCHQIVEDNLNRQIERLQKQLSIATKALKDILNDGDDYCDKDKAQEALKEMEGVK